MKQSETEWNQYIAWCVSDFVAKAFDTCAVWEELNERIGSDPHGGKLIEAVNRHSAISCEQVYLILISSLPHKKLRVLCTIIIYQ